MRSLFSTFFLALVISVCVCMNGVVGSSSHRFRKPRRERIAENVEASTAEKIKKLFKVLTKGDKPIAIEDLTKKIVESKITTYGSEEIIENIKQFDDGDNFLNFEEFQNLIIFDEGEEFVTDNDIQDFLNKFDGSKDGLISKAESNPI